jgi:Zn-dependent peptidase ImmA (M78 family)
MTRSNQNVESIAYALRAAHGVAGHGIRDIFSFTEKLGYRSIRYPFGEEAFCGMAVHYLGERYVVTNSSLVLGREIFTAAHEIGHHQLHLKEGRQDSVLDLTLGTSQSPIEHQADGFAAALLLPQQDLETFVLHRLGKTKNSDFTGFDIARIQTEFATSHDAVVFRLRKLGFLREAQSEILRQEKSETGANMLLKAIGGNTELCRASWAIRIPQEFIDWTLENYRNRLIRFEKLSSLLSLIGIDAEPFRMADTDTNDEPEDGSFEVFP